MSEKESYPLGMLAWEVSKIEEMSSFCERKKM